MALPGSQAGAGRVHQDPVEADAAGQGIDGSGVRFHRGGGLGGLGSFARGVFDVGGGEGIPETPADVKSAGSSGAAAEMGQAPGSAIAGPNHPAILHKIGQVHCLAAFAGAGVPPGFTRLGCGDFGDQLGGQVLNLETTFLEGRGMEEVGGPQVSEGIGGHAFGRNGVEEFAGQVGCGAGSGP